MKISKQLATGVLTAVAIALCGAFEVSHAQAVTASSSSSSDEQLVPRARPVREFLRALKQLNLSDDQKQQIKSLVIAARQSLKSETALDLSVLANPSDPNYASTLQAVKDRAASRIQRWSEVQLQVFNVLTPEQKAQLPQVLSAIQARSTQRRAAAAS
jgi:Spy/CpxP family protein refolding chaperone